MPGHGTSPMLDGLPEDQLEVLAGRFRLLADGTRLAILRALIAGGELSVGRVVELTGRGQANVSKHLKQMAGAGLVVRRKEGLQVFYRLGDPAVEKVCHLMWDSVRDDLRARVSQHRSLLGLDGES